MFRRTLLLTLALVLTVSLSLSGCGTKPQDTSAGSGIPGSQTPSQSPAQTQVSESPPQGTPGYNYLGVWVLTSFEYDGVSYVGQEQMGVSMTFYIFENGVGVEDSNGKQLSVSWVDNNGLLVVDNHYDTLTFVPEGETLTISQDGYFMVFEHDYRAECGYTFDTGSAKFLEGRNLVVTIFVDVGDYQWSNKDFKAVSDKYVLAKDFLESEATRYGKSLDLICDFDANPDLAYRMIYEGEILKLSADGQSMSTEGEGALYSLIHTINTLDYFIVDNIPYKDLAEKYKTSSIVYCFQVKQWASANFEFYYNPDIIPSGTYSEKIVMFDIEQWGAEALPHEILHAFGAVDLYIESPVNGVGNDLVQHAKQEYPKDIMGAWGERQVQNKVVYEIDPITAYCIGWLDDIPETSEYPAFNRHSKAAFYDHRKVIDVSQIKDGGDFPSAGGSVKIDGITQFKFVPDHTDLWILSSSDCGSSRPMVELYDYKHKLLANSMMHGGGYNGQLIAPLEQGKTYYLRASFVDPAVGDNAKGSYTLNMRLPETLSGSGGEISMVGGKVPYYYFTPDKSGTWEIRDSMSDGSGGFYSYEVFYEIRSKDKNKKESKLTGEFNNKIGEAWPANKDYDSFISVKLEAGQTYLIELGAMERNASYTATVSMK